LRTRLLRSVRARGGVIDIRIKRKRAQGCDCAPVSLTGGLETTV
jgi:hypothetical protein